MRKVARERGTVVLVPRRGWSGSEEGRLRPSWGPTSSTPGCLAGVECSGVQEAGHAEVSGAQAKERNPGMWREAGLDCQRWGCFSGMCVTSHCWVCASQTLVRMNYTLSHILWQRCSPRISYIHSLNRTGGRELETGVGTTW